MLQTEAQSQRQVEGFPRPAQRLFHLRRQSRARPGRAEDGDDVYIAFRNGGVFAHPFFRCVLADQRDQIDAVRFQRGSDRGAFVKRQIRHDAAGDARLCGIGGEAFQPVLEERIEVAHEHDARLEVPGALLEAVHDPVQADALFQRAAGSVLHDRAVGHGIGERHADFDHVRAVGVQFFNDAPERVERGEACGDEGNERRASGCVRIPYFLFKKSHDGSPRYASGGKGGYRPP